MSDPSPDEIIRKLDSEISEINTNLMDVVKSKTKSLTDKIQQANEETESIARFPEENPHSVIRASSAGKIIFANQSAMETILASLKVKVGGQAPSELCADIDEVMKKEDYVVKEHVISSRIYSCTFVPVSEHDYVNIYGVDVTDRQKEIESLARFPDENPHSVFRISEDGTVIFANTPAREKILSGLDVDVGDKVSGEILEIVLSVFKTEEFADIDHIIDERIYACSFVPVTKHSYVNVYGVDITAKIKAQEEMEQANQELIQAEKMSSLGVVISGIAHEIRNPLQVVMAMSESIAEDDDLERMRSDAKEIIDASKRMANIVSDLSGHARDARTLGDSTIYLNEVADKSLALSKHTRNLNKVKIVRQYEGKPTTIGSTSEITQIITNFINNGVDAMEAVGTITVATGVDNGTCYISVTDTGTGMNEETQKQIFDPFFTTKEAGKGTGLGLHVVNKIVTKHKAELHLDSALGKGSTFKVVFPKKP